MGSKYVLGRPARRLLGLGAAATVMFGTAAAIDAQAASAPPAPKPYGGASAQLYATGMDNVTSMAWGDGAMFAGDSGNSEKLPNGGVYVVKDGKGTKVPDSPNFVGGMTWHDGALYLSAATAGQSGISFTIERWSHFNGTTFRARKVLYTAPKGFQGFNGVGFGADGRLYVGVDAGLLDSNDHGPASTSPDLYDILSMTATGKDVKVFATGMRQPWQLAFAPGSSSPYVSDLGQDLPKSVATTKPPDMVLKVKAGDDYGFPTCNQGKGSTTACAGKAQPLLTFAPHSSIMGMAVMDKKLYMTSFTGLDGKGGALLSTSLSGGTVAKVVTGFPLAADALAAHDGKLYVGGSTRKGAGVIYQVTP